MAKKSKNNNKTLWGVLGVILVIIGVTSSISLAIQSQILGVSISAVVVIIGVILVAWAFGD